MYCKPAYLRVCWPTFTMFRPLSHVANAFHLISTAFWTEVYPANIAGLAVEIETRIMQCNTTALKHCPAPGFPTLITTACEAVVSRDACTAELRLSPSSLTVRPANRTSDGHIRRVTAVDVHLCARICTRRARPRRVYTPDHDYRRRRLLVYRARYCGWRAHRARAALHVSSIDSPVTTGELTEQQARARLPSPRLHKPHLVRAHRARHPLHRLDCDGRDCRHGSGGYLRRTQLRLLLLRYVPPSVVRRASTSVAHATPHSQSSISWRVESSLRSQRSRSRARSSVRRLSVLHTPHPFAEYARLL